jgi:8-oxo-dGTP pyrophosphatase MutT (NUDIX family)
MSDTQQIAAGALFLTSDTNRVLLQLRASWKSSHRNEWSLFGGLAKGDETPSEAMRRECTEEMGMFPEVTKIYPFDIYESRDKGFRYYTFIVVVDKEFQPTINDESLGYGWFDFGIWPKPQH